MAHTRNAVARRLRGRLWQGENCCDVSVTLIYTKQDPLAVTADIAVGDLTTRWVFCRDLLGNGIHSQVSAPAGHHQVRVWADGFFGEPAVFLELAATRCATIRLNRTDIIEFLTDSYRIVPAGTEHWYIDVAAELNRALAP